MGGEKHGSRSGRYVGGFLQLFDWNAKSRKKLFSSKPDLPEQSKQGKKGEGNLPMTRILMVEEEEFGGRLTMKGGSDYSCASSVTDDDGYGTKAPGVVARLMGLDSLPTSNPLDPYSTPFLDSLSLRDAPFRGRDLDLYHDHQIMHSSHQLDKVGIPPRNALNNTRPRKMPSNNKPIEKFQSEILPPKSAKTIPITHHKLLSPIKSPIFVHSQDAAHIMEAAAKIIEPGPQPTPRKRISSTGSSSVPFKVREMKDKLEATQRPSRSRAPEISQRPVESNAAKCLKGQPMNKSWNGSVDAISTFKVSPSRDDKTIGVKNKGKSISLAIQAKVNVQKREGSSFTSLGKPEDEEDTKSNQSFKITNRKSSTQSTSSSVLRQNNQKQNCSKPSFATSTGKKTVSEDTSHGRQKSSMRDSSTSRKSSRKSSLKSRDVDKEVPYSELRNVPRKKRSIEESRSHNKEVDRQYNWIEESRKKGMDVVSFTFNAPITRPLGEKSSNIRVNDKSKKLMSSDMNMRGFCSQGLNVIGGDVLSVLLEQKLKELSSNLENSHVNFITSMESPQKIVIPGTAESATGKAREKKPQSGLQMNNLNSQIFSELSPTEHEELRKTYNFQAMEANKTETNKCNDGHLPSPVSILEPSILTESCYSSESIASSSIEERKQCSSVQAQEVLGSSSSQKFHMVETETDISDSASSASSQNIAAKDSMKSTTWELGYVKDILCNVELMFKDYATGRTREIVNPHLFDQMERRRGGLSSTREDKFRLERKILFDCVSETLDLKCHRFVGSGFEMWRKGNATVKRKERLAEEVYKEIEGWRSLGNSMVDELVDKDMSSKYGRWVDFEVDEFMVGVELEGQILDSLIVEIIADILPCKL